MLLPQRMEMISAELQAQGCVYVSEMAKKIGVTEKTVRQDLIRMEEMGILDRVHGGAVPKKDGAIFPVAPRKERMLLEKKQIAKAAVSLIEDNDIIFFDAGSTCLELARLIDRQQIIALTNDPFIINEFLYKTSVTLYVVGGRLLREENGFILSDSDLITGSHKYNANKCFIGTSALNLQNGLMTFSSEQAMTKRAIVDCSSQVICLADHSKFGKMAFTSFATLDQVGMVVTDPGIAQQDRAALENRGIRVITAADD